MDIPPLKTLQKFLSRYNKIKVKEMLDMKKILCAVLVAAMLLGSVDMTAFAAENDAQISAVEADTAAEADTADEATVENAAEADTADEAVAEDEAEAADEAVAEDESTSEDTEDNNTDKSNGDIVDIVIKTEEAVSENDTTEEIPVSEEAVLTEAGAASGACGTSCTWTLADGVLTISGTGAMQDFEKNGGVLHGIR